MQNNYFIELRQGINLKTILEQIAKNNPRAFQLFYEYSYTQVYRYVSYFLSDTDDCKDVVSEVYCRLWQNRQKLTSVKNVDNYLFICVRNEALSFLRKANRYRMESIDKAERIKLTERDDPEESLLNGELREILELSINSLPERCRQVFFLVKEEEMRYRDVAKCMGISEKTVHAQMCIAIKRIAKTINEHGLGNK